MSANTGEALRQHLLTIKRWALLGVLCFLAAAVNVRAQNTFSSGSTGSDGAFSPTANQTIVVPDSGVFNFTTVNIPTNVTITFSRNLTNKPLTILASGDVVIAGSINIDGKPGNSNGFGGQGGPGGFGGGAGGYGFDQSFTGVPGDGPGSGGGGIGSTTITLPGGGGGGGFGTNGAAGGGGSNAGQAGLRFGTVTIIPLIGGSGGGGGGAINNNRGGAAGGGGGAILIASSGIITISGSITSRGGNGNSGNAGGGGGSGGAIRLIANTISGAGNLNVSGGSGGGANTSFNGGIGGQGYIRIEAYDYSGFAGSSTPTNIISFAFPHPVTSPNSPSLRIASVGGVAAPSSPFGSLQGVPDVIVPSTQTNPMTVALEGSNLPLGTIIQVAVTPSRGSKTTVQSTGLAGTEIASTATASVTLPGGISVVSASAVIDLTLAKLDPIFVNGERVRQIEVAATFGGASELIYVTESGRRIKRTTD
jgi:hypothetical protein